MLILVAGLVVGVVAIPFVVVAPIFLDAGKFLTWVGHKALGADGGGHPLRVGAVAIGFLGFLLTFLPPESLKQAWSSTKAWSRAREDSIDALLTRSDLVKPSTWGFTASSARFY